jgi:hypothetical protein
VLKSHVCRVKADEEMSDVSIFMVPACMSAFGRTETFKDNRSSGRLAHGVQRRAGKKSGSSLTLFACVGVDRT